MHAVVSLNDLAGILRTSAPYPANDTVIHQNNHSRHAHSSTLHGRFVTQIIKAIRSVPTSWFGLTAEHASLVECVQP